MKSETIEVLFRGKRTDNDEWVEGLYFLSRFDSNPFQFGFNHMIQVVDIDNVCYECYQVRPETIGQLIDRIGETKVFDGDIFRFEGAQNKFGYIVQVEESFQAICYHTNLFDFEQKHYRWGHFYRIKELGWEKEFILMGNVHDNPELIGKEVPNV